MIVARQILNGVPANSTWSNLLQNPILANARVPLPIIVATGRTSIDDVYIPGATVYEMTPFEFGSWDPVTINAFSPMRLLGTPMARGYPSTAYCMTGFDNAAWVTSNNIFFD